ncbi:unnamed protein product [Prorocentrum cordatum]|uniref:Uncharacterized protein n=1 Tax=Prorocentrum cordatum TaxID=2364126 RepID=A0ABN9SIM2_9DINO|nr:unnamed protein product [Polarella glacialis]
MQALDLTRCEKQPLAASVAAGTGATVMPRLAPLSPNAYVGPAGASGAGLSSLAAAQSLVAQANITPEQLLLAAQQLAAQQRQQQQPPPAAGGGQGAPSAGLASLEPSRRRGSAREAAVSVRHSRAAAAAHNRRRLA